MKLEDYPQTHEGAVDFVRDVFRGMGGKVIPPRRPGIRHTACLVTVASFTADWDDFMRDFENACLKDNWNKPHPNGAKRHENPEWGAMIQSQVYPHHSDVDWEEYVEWVSNGGGDEWFQDEGRRQLSRKDV